MSRLVKKKIIDCYDDLYEIFSIETNNGKTIKVRVLKENIVHANHDGTIPDSPATLMEIIE